MSTNNFGLSRNIPEEIKRIVRKNCGFGCIFCGLWIYEYEHIFPSFVEAKLHDPERICLLCPTHHTRVTKGLISKDEVFLASKNPRALQKGFSHDAEFTRIQRPAHIQLGRMVFIDPKKVLQIDEETILSLNNNPDEGPLQLNGRFYDKSGNLILEIRDNEWRAFTDNWDVEQVGKKLVIKERLRGVSLTIIAESPQTLIFDNVHIFYNGVTVESKLNTFVNIVTPQGGGIHMVDSVTTVGPILIDSKNGSTKIMGRTVIM